MWVHTRLNTTGKTRYFPFFFFWCFSLHIYIFFACVRTTCGPCLPYGAVLSTTVSMNMIMRVKRGGRVGEPWLPSSTQRTTTPRWVCRKLLDFFFFLQTAWTGFTLEKNNNKNTWVSVVPSRQIVFRPDRGEVQWVFFGGYISPSPWDRKQNLCSWKPANHKYMWLDALPGWCRRRDARRARTTEEILDEYSRTCDWLSLLRIDC